uniref:Uncharacterized protein n=1 Tax=Oryza glumipatula TaxID=40148 RepID=A0A0E0BGG6_9ORYZ
MKDMKPWSSSTGDSGRAKEERQRQASLGGAATASERGGRSGDDYVPTLNHEYFGGGKIGF